MKIVIALLIASIAVSEKVSISDVGSLGTRRTVLFTHKTKGFTLTVPMFYKGYNIWRTEIDLPQGEFDFVVKAGLRIVRKGSITQAKLAENTEFRTMTFNIRYDEPEDGINQWKFRKDFLVETMLKYEPKIIGTQEVLNNQKDYLVAGLGAQFGYHGRPRDKEMESEASGIFYDLEMFSKIDGTFFWLSETPDEDGSIGWDASCERICSVLVLRTRKDVLLRNLGNDILVINCHYDHVGSVARKESSKLILARVEKYKAEFSLDRVIVMGDFNGEETEETIQLLQAEFLTSGLGDERKTFHDFIGGAGTEKIDFVFYSDNLDHSEYDVVTDSREGLYPSDHYGVVSTIKTQ